MTTLALVPIHWGKPCQLSRLLHFTTSRNQPRCQCTQSHAHFQRTFRSTMDANGTLRYQTWNLGFACQKSTHRRSCIPSPCWDDQDYAMELPGHINYLDELWRDIGPDWIFDFRDGPRWDPNILFALIWHARVREGFRGPTYIPVSTFSPVWCAPFSNVIISNWKNIITMLCWESIQLCILDLYRTAVHSRWKHSESNPRMLSMCECCVLQKFYVS